MRVRHKLSNDPRLRRSELMNLASNAAPRNIEHHLSALPVLLPTGEAPQLPLNPAVVVSEIKDNDCWLGLFHLERQDTYRQLLDECVGSWASSFGSEGGVKSTTANVFLASPHSVTPAHIDCHHNLLLQIEGTKEVVVGVFDSPAHEVAEVNGHFSPRHSNLATLPARSTSWLIGPGEGLYLPPYTPHWVLTGNQVSVSLSCVVVTPGTQRVELAHVANARLRRLGLHPVAAGNVEAIDAAKSVVVKAVRRSAPIRRAESGPPIRRDLPPLASPSPTRPQRIHR